MDKEILTLSFKFTGAVIIGLLWAFFVYLKYVPADVFVATCQACLFLLIGHSAGAPKP